MHRLVNCGGRLVPPADVEEQLAEAESRPSRVHDEHLPPPPKQPSLIAAQARLWTPPVVAAVITAVASVLVQWMAGFGQVELDPVTKARLDSLPAIASDLAELKADVKGLGGQRISDREADQDRRREVDSELARHQQQIESLRDRYR